MRKIRSVSVADNAMVAEAGVILTQVHEAAEAADRLFPLSLGAKGSATVGGLVSTNAGGVQVLRYGTMRGLTLGIEAVLADGTVHHGLTPLRKDNRGYDLKQLLIGAEGTLGVITAATLALVPRPVERVTAWAGLASLPSALKVLRRLEAATGGQISSFELIPGRGLDLVLAHLPGTRSPLPAAHEWHVLVEADTARPGDNLSATVEQAFAIALEAGEIADAVVAATEAQASALWLLRESLPEAERREGAAAKHDIAVAVADMPIFIEKTSPAVEAAFPGARVLAFGHLGDGNVHFNVRPPLGGGASKWLDTHMEAINRFVHDAVAAMGGTLSAEHGIGLLKRDEFARLAAPGQLNWMRAVKLALDPDGILNPGKLLPPCE
jgi:FAD/FMN-containing dehydrogenase